MQILKLLDMLTVCSNFFWVYFNILIEMLVLHNEMT